MLQLASRYKNSTHMIMISKKNMFFTLKIKPGCILVRLKTHLLIKDLFTKNTLALNAVFLKPSRKSDEGKEKTWHRHLLLGSSRWISCYCQTRV